MEGPKVVDIAELLGSEDAEGIFWQWQSGPNPDPWAEEDPAKWTWQDYSDDDCCIIEEASLLKKEIADLKDYEVDLKKMIQVNKQFRNRVRRVRRQEKSRFMMKMSEPLAVVRDEKTINQAFGTIQHFLDYIMKRTPEAYGLYQRLKTLKLDFPNESFKDIMEEVISCIEKGAETREKIIKTRSGSQTTNFLAKAKEIINSIENNSAVLQDFLKVILKVYTMETFICYWLNELLRSENWEEINVLTPYLVCLVYTFKLSEFVCKSQEPQGLMDSIRGFVGRRKSLILYRGAALPKKHLELYNHNKIKYFSWNAVTSTSRDKETALRFMKKAKRSNKSKVAVFFLIEIDIALPEDYEGMIDISEDSAYPEEQEVILAPGTVFEFQRSCLNENDICEISLKVTKNFDQTQDNIALLGKLHDQTILNDKAIIDGLPSQQSFVVLELLKGNKLIRKLEIRNSKIEEHLMQEIENLRLTTNVKKEDVKFRDNTIVVSNLGLLVHLYSAEGLNEIFIYNEIQFKGDAKDSKFRKNTVVLSSLGLLSYSLSAEKLTEIFKYKTNQLKEGEALRNKNFEIKSLIFSEEALERLQKNNQLKQFSEKLKDANEIEHLDLSIRKIEDIDDELIYFLRHIKELKQLQNLEIKVNQVIQRNDLEVICQTIEASSALNRLYLELTLSNESLISLEKALVLIRFVQNLSLSLKFDHPISDEVFGSLKSGLILLTSLKHLSLSFNSCNKISDEGLNHLKNSLISCTSLEYLSLDFPESREISSEGLSHLKIPLISLTFLQDLHLNFQYCNNISDEGINQLKDGFTTLTSLQSLSLNFCGCRISDEGLNHLKICLGSLTSLQRLNMDFSKNCNITNLGLVYLRSGLISLQSLQDLSLCFDNCYKISEEGRSYFLNQLKSIIQHVSFSNYM